jgi:predicted nucleotidyltransferase
MGLSKRYLSENKEEIRFDTDRLGALLLERLPEAVFCLLTGSAAEGKVAPESDLDLAFLVDGRPSFEFHTRIADAVAELLPSVRCDTGFLNNAEPVYRFEALKGRLLFVRDRERFASFYSITCREYESQMASYERQRKYRLAAAHVL